MPTLRVTLTLAIALVASHAAADPKRANQLFEEGQALKKAGDMTKACEKFEQAFALDPSAVGFALNVADCKERAGKTASAWKQFKALADDLDRKKDARAKYARERADALEPKLSKITIDVKPRPLPAGVAITIDKQPVAVANEMIEVRDPGPYEIVVSAPGMKPIARKGTLRPAVRETEVFQLEPAAVVVKPPVRDQPATRRAPGRVRLALGLGAGGVVLLGTTAVISVLAKGKYKDAIDSPECMKDPLVCTPAGSDKIDNARSLAKIGTFTGIAGVGMLVGAGVLFFTAPRERLAVGPGPGTVGLAALGRF